MGSDHLHGHGLPDFTLVEAGRLAAGTMIGFGLMFFAAVVFAIVVITCFTDWSK